MSINIASDGFNPRDYQPALPLPVGFSKERILESLVSVSIDGSATGELTGYATEDCERFLYTLGLIPESSVGTLLEIGANPYFTTLLLRRFRPELQLRLINYFGAAQGEYRQRVSYNNFSGESENIDFDYFSCNTEFEKLPFDDQSLDWVIFCEVLEHMTNDPLAVLLELKRVLKPSGRMIVSTPNVARIENVVALLEGRNLYDPYSGYGPYGRHNREYTRHELHELLKHSGFSNEVSFTANVHDDSSWRVNDKDLKSVLSAVQHREHDLGQYLFTRWVNSGAPNPKKPSWLYRSYPAEKMA